MLISDAFCIFTLVHFWVPRTGLRRTGVPKAEQKEDLVHMAAVDDGEVAADFRVVQDELRQGLGGVPDREREAVRELLLQERSRRRGVRVLAQVEGIDLGVRVRKIGKISKNLQIFGGLVLGCIKTKFCKKICV